MFVSPLLPLYLFMHTNVHILFVSLNSNRTHATSGERTTYPEHLSSLLVSLWCLFCSVLRFLCSVFFYIISCPVVFVLLANTFFILRSYKN